jgi:hypothetical protein
LEHFQHRICHTEKTHDPKQCIEYSDRMVLFKCTFYKLKNQKLTVMTDAEGVHVVGKIGAVHGLSL